MRFKSLWYFSLIFSVVLTSCPKSSGILATQSGNWIKGSEFGGVTRAEAVSFVIGDTAYIATGYNPNNTIGSLNNRLNDCWSYDVNTGGWEQVTAFPGTQRSSAVAFAAGTKGYVGTGTSDGVTFLNDFWEYNSATGFWAQKANFGGSARYDASAFGIGANGYVTTGFDGNYLKDFWKYDPAADSWTQLTTFGGSKRSAAVTFVYNNKGYILTGANNGQPVNDMWQYDPATGTGGTWTQERQLTNVSTDSYDDLYTSIVRNNSVGFVMGGKGYISTGDNANGSLMPQTWEYDFTKDQWTQKSDFEQPSRSAAVAFSVKDRGFIVTGKNSTLYFDDIKEFHPNETLNLND